MAQPPSAVRIFDCLGEEPGPPAPCARSRRRRRARLQPCVESYYEAALAAVQFLHLSPETATALHKSGPSPSRSRCAADSIHPPGCASARMSPAHPLAAQTVCSRPPDNRSSAPDSSPEPPAMEAPTAQTISPPSGAACPSGQQSTPHESASHLPCIVCLI